MERRLAAIFAADVVGYSRLIRGDEEGNDKGAQVAPCHLVDLTIAEYNGRIITHMGDGMFVEFASVVDAVRATAETQQALAERNAGLPE
jgi:adenylate cyclase